MNQITYQDFGLLKSEFLNVDYICFNINSSSSLSQIAYYVLGFNCYQKNREENKSRKEFNNRNNFKNKYELTFITNISYWNKTQVQFVGFYTNYFYELIKKGLDFNEFYEIISRFDLYFERNYKTADKISGREFLQNFQKNLKQTNKNISLEKNRKG